MVIQSAFISSQVGSVCLRATGATIPNTCSYPLGWRGGSGSKSSRLYILQALLSAAMLCYHEPLVRYVLYTMEVELGLT